MANISVKIIIDAVNNASKELGKIGDSVSDVGRSFSILGAGATVALGFAAKAAIDYEDAFAGVRKTVEASDSEFSKLSQNLRDIAKSAPISAVELAGIAMMAGQLGVTGVDNIAKFTDTIAKFTSATGVAGDEAASSFAQIANVMQEPIKNIDRMGSVVAKLGDSGAATERQILDFSARIAGAGKIAGFTTKDIFGIGSAMASVGIEAEAGGTAVQKVLIDMNTAAITGGKDLETFAKTSGMTVKQFVSSWGSDAQGTFTKFVEGLGKQGDNAILTLSELGLEDQRLIRSFLSLANAGSLLSDQLKISAGEWTENTRLQQEAAKRYATTASQMQIFKNNVNDVGITLGAALLPSINKIITAVTPLITRFADFAEKNPELIVNILAIGAAMAGLGITLITVGAIMSAFTVIMAAVASPIILIVAAIVAVVALLALAWTKNFLGIQDIVKSVSTNVVAFLQGALAFIQQIPIWVGEAIVAVTTWFQNLVIFIQSIPALFALFVEQLKASIYTFFVQTLPFAIGFLVGQLIKFVTVDIPAFVNAVVAWFQQLPTRTAAILQEFGNNVQQWFTTTTNWAIDQATKLVTNVINWFKSMPSAISNALSQLPGIITQWFSSAKEAAVSKAREIHDGVKAWFDKIINFFKDIVSWAGQAISKSSEAVSAGFNAGKRQFGGPVRADTPYVVGERGPEIFMPAGAGSIVPNHAGGGGSGGGTTIQFFVNAETIVNSPTERRGLAEALYKDLRDLARSQNMSVAEYFGG